MTKNGFMAVGGMSSKCCISIHRGYYAACLFCYRAVNSLTFLLLYSGNLATGDTEDRLRPTTATGAKVVGPPGLYNGRVSIAVGGAHYLAARVASSNH